MKLILFICIIIEFFSLSFLYFLKGKILGNIFFGYQCSQFIITYYID
jgi:hypothetical protein